MSIQGNKIKFITKEDHEEIFKQAEGTDNKEWVTPLTNMAYTFGISVVDALQDEAIKAGWHCGACKMYAMMHNYNFLQKALVGMTELTKAQIVDSFPFSSD